MARKCEEVRESRGKRPASDTSRTPVCRGQDPSNGRQNSADAEPDTARTVAQGSEYSWAVEGTAGGWQHCSTNQVEGSWSGTSRLGRGCPQSPTVKCYWAQWDRLTLIDGVLHRRWESVAGDKEHWQLLGPKDLKDAILREVHDVPAAGHLGAKKTSIGGAVPTMCAVGADSVTCARPAEGCLRALVARWRHTTSGPCWKELL